MDRKILLQEMRDSVGSKDPIEFFKHMTDVFNLLFDKMENMEKELYKIKNNSALSIEWNPNLALSMISNQIDVLREDKDTYFNEITKLKSAYVENKVTQNYNDFCQFWVETLGWHPFLTY